MLAIIGLVIVAFVVMTLVLRYHSKKHDRHAESLIQRMDDDEEDRPTSIDSGAFPGGGGGYS